MATMKVLVNGQYVEMPYYAAHYFAGEAGVNLAVVGGDSAPTTPAENTIWVNTTTDIPEWQFSATQPTERTDGTPLSGGEVWVVTGNGTVALNAVNGYGIVLHPSAAYQYVDGAWVEKEAQLYKNEEWVSVEVLFDGIMYLYGDERTAATGGWGIDGYVVGTRGNTAATKQSDHLYFEGITGTGSDIPTVILGTLKAVDFTDFNTLTVDFEVLSNVDGSTISVDMRVGTAKNYISKVIADFGAPDGRKTVEYDVSGITGKQYFVIVASRNESNKANVYSIKLS